MPLLTFRHRTDQIADGERVRAVIPQPPVGIQRRLLAVFAYVNPGDTYNFVRIFEDNALRHEHLRQLTGETPRNIYPLDITMTPDRVYRVELFNNQGLILGVTQRPVQITYVDMRP